TIPDEGVTFQFLGPTENLANDYELELIDNLEGMVGDDGKVLNDDWQPDKVNHNRASPAILLEYGKTKILLGGDMEAEAWNSALCALGKSGRPASSLPCHLLKVSHHGSTTGLPDELCRALQAGGRPVAVLTPFKRHQSPLPSCDGVELLTP